MTGKRVARKKGEEPGAEAVVCATCGQRYHEEYNFACAALRKVVERVAIRKLMLAYVRALASEFPASRDSEDMTSLQCR